MNVYLWPNQSLMKNAYIGEVWTPWSNTIAYFPFTNNALDQLGNYTLSNSWTKQSIWYLFNVVTNVNIWWWAYSDQKFASYWVKFANSSTVSVLIWVWWMRLNNRVISSPSYSEFVFKDSGWSFHNLWNNWINNNTWYHIAYWWDWTSYKTYINGELKNSWSATPASYSESWIASWSWVILSDLIYEKSMRTAQEILNYYNNTKSDYWL